MAQFLGKLKAIGNSIGDVAKDVGDTVANAGTKVVGVVKEIPNSIGHNSDFDHIKSINELARQKPVQREHHYTDAEWAEAERRADAVLDKLFPGYFEEGFDPVKYELEQLSVEAGPDEIDAIVDKLTLGVEVSSVVTPMQPMPPCRGRGELSFIFHPHATHAVTPPIRHAGMRPCLLTSHAQQCAESYWQAL